MSPSCGLSENVHLYLKEHSPHPGHVHEHHSRVDPRPAVEGVTGEATVPGNARLLMLRGHRGQLGGSEFGQKCPQVIYGLEEEDVGVDVNNRVNVL